MNKRIKYFLLLFQVILIISGCSNAGDNLVSNKNETNQGNTGVLHDGSNLEEILKIHFIDVGQADSILIQIGENACLIDAGNNEDSDLVSSYLKEAGVKKLNYIIGTHPHEDHIGGLDVIIDNFQFDKVILPEYTLTTKTFLDVLDAIENKGLKITKPMVGDEYELGDASFTFIAPVERDYGKNANNYSVGIKLVYGKTSFVTVGDAEIEAEKDILGTGIDLTADLFKISHHGSHTSNSEELLKAIDPTFAVISVGEGNSYGHPNSNVVTTLIEDDVQIYRTDKQGTIVVTSDGINLSFKTKSKGSLDEINTNSGTVKEENSSEKIIYRTKTGSKYHIKSCRFLKDSKIKVTLKEAKNEGLLPCSECNP
jgi:competence protein ComEC